MAQLIVGKIWAWVVASATYQPDPGNRLEGSAFADEMISNFNNIGRYRIYSQKKTPRSGVAIKKNSLVYSLLQHCLKLKRKFLKFIQGRGDSMSNQAVTEYLMAVLSKYQNATKQEKSSLLDHAQDVTGLERKHLIKRLHGSLEDMVRQKGSGRPHTYSEAELLPHIRYVWEQMERISAPRMREAMADWLPRYRDCPAHLRLQLMRMSASTLGRYLSKVRTSLEATKGLSTTSPARYMRNKVPINTLDSKVTEPGHTQTDTVAHCGTSALGPFISSLTVTDILTTWTENRAMFTKQGTVVKQNFKDIERSLPFAFKSINADSGSEFLNKQMLQFTGHGRRISFTRSRPYKKNDNCYVEQKNFTHVRELFGYERFEDEILVELMNEIYTKYWNPLQNYFLPTFKLKEKIRIGARIQKKYDKPKTPYQRLIESNCLTEQEKEALMLKKAQLDPFELKRNLEIKLKEFFEVVRKQNIRKAA